MNRLLGAACSFVAVVGSVAGCVSVERPVDAGQLAGGGASGAGMGASGAGKGASGAGGASGSGGARAGAGAGAGGAGNAGAAGVAGASGSSGAGAGGRSGAGSGGGGAGGSAAAGAGGTGGSAGAPSGARWVSGYYVGYQAALYPPENIEWSGLTHLMIGRVIPNADGTLTTHYDIDSVQGPMLAKQLVELAHQHGKKAIVMLGGAGEVAGFVGAASNANRAKFVQNLVALANEVGFDGFDIDWEPLATEQEPQLLELAKALKAADADYVLTFPLNWLNPNWQTAPAFFADLAEHMDQLNLMSYAMAGKYENWQSWHSSALKGHGGNTPSSVESSIDLYLAAGVPANKLGVGVGFFGLCWSPPITAPRQPLDSGDLIAADNAMSYTNIMASYYSASARKWDATASVPYLELNAAQNPLGCSMVSYEDAQSIEAKAAWVKQKGLGGAIVWTINQGYLPSAPAGMRDPLMIAMKSFF